MDILNYGFFQNALWGIGLISITAAVIGVYVVCRRMHASVDSDWDISSVGIRYGSLWLLP